MKFEYKTLKEVSEMAIEDQEVYQVAKETYENGLKKAELEKAIADSANKTNEEIAALKSELKDLTTNLEKELLRMKSLTEVGKSNEPTTKTLTAEVKENKDLISKIAKGISADEIVIKADTNRASVTGSTSDVFLQDVGQLGVKRRSLYDVLPKFNLGNGNDQGRVRYIDWDEATTVRAAAMVAEGATFPESTAKFQQYSIDLKKIGDTLPVTEEFLEDEVTLSNELAMFLETNVNTVIDSQIINGNGTGQNLTGLVTSVPAYTPVASGISDANIYDLVKKVSTDIKFNRGSKYSPDMVVANANVLDQLWLHKDANDNYIFRDMQRIGSIELIEDNNMADNTLIVGDKRYARIYEKGGVVLSKGQPNAQFVEDMFTIKARKRMLFLIREVDKTGFRKVTDVAAALAVLATP